MLVIEHRKHKNGTNTKNAEGGSSSLLLCCSHFLVHVYGSHLRTWAIQNVRTHRARGVVDGVETLAATRLAPLAGEIQGVTKRGRFRSCSCQPLDPQAPH